MDKVARMSPEDRRDIFTEAAARFGIRPAILEKDFWVCVVLKLRFQTSPFAQTLVFKGGTSLSKAHGLIERNVKLLQDVVVFKQRFYPSAWARYDLAVPGFFKLPNDAGTDRGAETRLCGPAGDAVRRSA